MTCRAVALLIHREQDHVLVAVDANLAHHLEVPRLLALAPEPIARSREVTRAAGADGFLERLAVHPGEHHDPVARMILGDYRDYAAAFVEVDRRCRLSCHDRFSVTGRISSTSRWSLTRIRKYSRMFRAIQ